MTMNPQEIDPKRSDDYRWLAWMYDSLADLVFGGEILRAQRALLTSNVACLSQSKCILWIGGGTGRVLNELLSLAPHAHVIYVEPSAQMLARAINNVDPRSTHRVRWVHRDHRWLWEPRAEADLERIDVMITAFFLDVLPEEECRALALHASPRVRSWLFADFIPQRRRWAQALIAFMYLCFTIVTRIKQRKMLDLLGVLRREGWRTRHPAQPVNTFARGLIQIDHLIYDPEVNV